MNTVAAQDELERIYDAAADLDAGEECAAEEIREAFAQMTKGKWDTEVPYVTGIGGLNTTQSLKQTVLHDLIQDGQVDDELIAVLQLSACPRVAALRVTLAQRWVQRNARVIAEARR